MFVIALLGSLLSGCASAGLMAWNSALKLGADHKQVSDLSYGDGAWQKLDVHIPEDNGTSERPVLVFFYGGSWDSGSKEMYFFYANTFTELGYVVVIPDYSKWPDARFPDFMYDGAAAIAWTRDNISRYGGDPDKILVSGHSAGAHLGALLLADDRYLAEHSLKPTDIRAFAGLAGPYNFTPTAPKLVEIFGPPEKFSMMQVNSFVSGNEPPMLLLHGADDGTVGVENQNALLNELQRVGNPSKAVVYPGLGHVGILLSLRSSFNQNDVTVQDKHAFFQSVLQQQSQRSETTNNRVSVRHSSSQ